MKSSYMPDTDSEDELPPGWEETATDLGLVCYVNQQKKVKQWTHPRTGRTKRIGGELPIGWEATVEDQRVVFYNKQTKQKTFADPRLAFATEEPPLSADQVRQRFDSSSTALQVLHGRDLSGRLAVVTGANAGIGFETARSLAMHGCTVVFACRNRKSAELTMSKILEEKPSAQCRFMELDLGDFVSVNAFINLVKQTISHIDYLILNAGVFGLPYIKTIDGLESTFQICHLSHFHITTQLEHLLDHKSRVVIVSSESHRFANLPADGLTEEHLSPPAQKCWSMMAYNNAKLCNVLFAYELASRWKSRGVSVFAVHPGNMVSSNLSRNWWFYRLLFAVVRPFTKSLQQAAATTVYSATANELTGISGYYLNNCFFCEPSKDVNNLNLRKQLWAISESMIRRISDDSSKGRNVAIL